MIYFDSQGSRKVKIPLYKSIGLFDFAKISISHQYHSFCNSCLQIGYFLMKKGTTFNINLRFCLPKVNFQVKNRFKYKALF